MSGLWTGTRFNNTLFTDTINNIFYPNAVAIVRKRHPLAAILMGETMAGPSQGDTGFNFEHGETTSGYNYMTRLLGKLHTTQSDPQLHTVASTAASVATANVDYDDSEFGAAEWPLTQWVKKRGISTEQYKKIEGKNAVTAKFIDEVVEAEIFSWEKILSTCLHTNTNDASRTNMTSWTWAVSDYSLESSGGTYGTIDRSDSGNADFRGTVAVNQGTLTLADIKHMINLAADAGGNIDLLVAGTSVHEIIERQISSYTHVTYNEKLARMGFKAVEYAGIPLIRDSDCPSGVLGGLDTSTWVFVDNESPPFSAGLIYAPWTEASYVIPIEIWSGFFCRAPSWNFKVTGIAA